MTATNTSLISRLGMPLMAAFLVGAAWALSPGVSHAGQVYSAVCETDHGFWSGPDRSSMDAAKADAVAHDKARHGGVRTATVFW